MNKKVEKNKTSYDAEEDLAIKKVVYKKDKSQYFLLAILIVLFGLTFFSCLYYIGDYYKEKYDYNKNAENIAINNKKINALITNNGTVDFKVTDDNAEEEKIVLESLSSVTLTTNNTSKSNGKLIFDVKYDITENTFPYNAVAKTDSSLLVRFAYSVDNENWTYVNNVISTNNSNITPLMGNYFDISGLKSTLSVKTNYELTSSPGKTEKIYWKSETVIIPNSNLKDSQIKANFYVEYRNNE